MFSNIIYYLSNTDLKDFFRRVFYYHYNSLDSIEWFSLCCIAFLFACLLLFVLSMIILPIVYPIVNYILKTILFKEDKEYIKIRKLYFDLKKEGMVEDNPLFKNIQKKYQILHCRNKGRFIRSLRGEKSKY